MSFSIFVREFVSNPRQIGSVIPSSKKLAREMASFVPSSPDGVVVELGAGTGVVTSALLERGIPPHQIIAIEQSPQLTHLFKKRFPDIPIILGDARRLCHLLAQYVGAGENSVNTVVSSLPFKSLPKSVAEEIGAELMQLLTERGLFIQFTYDLRSDASKAFYQLRRCRSKIVWRNFPPARVNAFHAVKSHCNKCQQPQFLS